MSTLWGFLSWWQRFCLVGMLWARGESRCEGRCYHACFWQFGKSRIVKFWGVGALWSFQRVFFCSLFQSFKNSLGDVKMPFLVLLIVWWGVSALGFLVLFSCLCILNIFSVYLEHNPTFHGRPLSSKILFAYKKILCKNSSIFFLITKLLTWLLTKGCKCSIIYKELLKIFY